MITQTRDVKCREHYSDGTFKYVHDGVCEIQVGPKPKVTQEVEEITPPLTPTISTPIITSPINNQINIGLLPTITIDKLIKVENQTLTSVRLHISESASFTSSTILTVSATSTSFAITDSALFKYNTTYYIKIEAVGSLTSSQSSVVSFKTLVASVVLAPTIEFPLNNAFDINLNPSILLSAFQNTGPTDTPKNTRIQIATDSGFVNIKQEYNNTYIILWVLSTNLLAGTKYYVRAQHEGNLGGWSPWSSTVSFTTAEEEIIIPPDPIVINTPTVNAPLNNATDIGLKPTITLTGFSNTGPTDTPKNTRIQVSLANNFLTNVFEYQNVYITSWILPGNLNNSTKYYVRAQHEGNLGGWSPWSPIISFTTEAAVIHTTNKPTVNSPLNNAIDIGLKPTITLTGFSSTGTDTAKSTQIEIATDSGFVNIKQNYNSTFTTSWTLPSDLNINTQYYIRAKHEGNVWGWSDWSTTVTFTTMNITIAVPVIISPTAGQNDVSLTPDVKINTVTVLNQTINSMEIDVSTDSGFSTKNTYTTSYNTTYTLPSLSYETTYYVRVRVSGSITGWTANSSTISFTTKAEDIIILPTYDWKIGEWVDQKDGTATRTVECYQDETTLVTDSYCTSPKPGTITTAISDYILLNPIIISPIGDQTGITFPLKVKTNEPVVANQTVTQKQIQISTNNTFAIITWDSTAITYTTDNLTTIDSSNMTQNTVYYVRQRFCGSKTSWTGWSSIESFKILDAFPSLLTPVLNAPVGNLVDFVMPIKVISYPPIVSTQVVSEKQIQISTSATGFDVPLWDSGAMTYTPDNLTYIGCELFLNTVYYVRQRLKGSFSGWTNWSTVINFKLTTEENQSLIFSINGTNIDSILSATKFKIK